MDFNYVFFPDHLTCKCTLYKKMRHFCDIGLHNCNFLLDYNDLTHNRIANNNNHDFIHDNWREIMTLIMTTGGKS